MSQINKKYCLNSLINKKLSDYNYKDSNFHHEKIDIVLLRKKYHMTQQMFAKYFGFNLRTLQQWEQGRRRPCGSTLLLLKVINYAPEIVNQALYN